jgi:hypothetical protein
LRSDGFGDGLSRFERFADGTVGLAHPAHEIQRLVDQQDRIIDHDPDQDNEAQHGQRVQLLLGMGPPHRHHLRY